MQMKTQFFLYFCCICCFSYGFADAANYEASALFSIKEGLIDPLNSLHDWELVEKSEGKDAAHCNWTGIRCNSGGAVEKLDLSRVNLSGIVSNEIQRLKSLISLNLCCNEFSSSLSPIGNLTTLKSFDVSQNFFTGD